MTANSVSSTEGATLKAQKHQRGKPAAVPRRVRAAMERAHMRWFALAARAHTAGLLSTEQVRQIRSETKRGASNKVLSIATAEELTELYATRANELEARLLQAGERSAPATTSTRRKPLDARRIGELPPRDIDERTRRLRIASAITEGSTAADALRAVSMAVTPTSRRWAQRLARRYEATGRLHDGRLGNAGRKPRVMVPAVRDVIEATWLTHRNLSARGIQLAIARQLERADAHGVASMTQADSELLICPPGAVVPSLSTIRRLIRTFSPVKTTMRSKGISAVTRQMRPTMNVEWATTANEEWQIDHTVLDLYAVVKEAGEWVVVRPTLTAIIDVHSRAIVSVIVSARPADAFTTAHALRMGIGSKVNAKWPVRGLPQRLVMDNGTDFRSSQVSALLGALRIEAHFCRPHRPDEKPHIERWFGTLTRELLPLLPGYTHGADRGAPLSGARADRLLTVPQIRDEVLRWVVEVYHQREHTATKRKPVELWVESCPYPRDSHPRDLDALLLHRVERRITRGVIRLGFREEPSRVYWTPAIMALNGQRVEVRYNPDELLSLVVYDAQTHEFIGEAWDLHDPRSPFTNGTVREAWHAHRAELVQQRREMEERLPAYFEQTANEDRKRRKTIKAEQDARRTEAEALLRTGDVAPVDATDADLAQEVAELKAILSGETPDPKRSAATADELTTDDLKAFRDSLLA